jgi:putative ABC transport system permease protein
MYFSLGSFMLLGLKWNSSAEAELEYARNKWGLKAIIQVNAKSLFEAKANSKSGKNPPQTGHFNESSSNSSYERFLPSQIATLSMKMADDVSNLPEVKSAQYTSIINVVGKGISPVTPAGRDKSKLETTEGIKKPQFQLMGVLKSEVLDAFKSNINILISGSDISPADLNTNNAIIEHGLADKNHLKIGDTFELESIDGNRTKSFIVSGIFISGVPQNSGLAGDLSFLSDKNRIFTSVTAMSELSGGFVENPIVDKAIFTLKNPDSYEQFRIKAMEKGINLFFYDIYKDDTQFKAVSYQLKKAISIGTILTLSTFIGLFLFTTLLLLAIRKKRSEEIQTLLLFGESNRNIFTQLLLEWMILIVIGFALAIIISPIALDKISYILKEIFFLIQENSTNNIHQSGNSYADVLSKFTQMETVLFDLDLKPNFYDQMGVTLIGLFLSVNAAVLTLLKVLRMSKRNLLMDSDLEESI